MQPILLSQCQFVPKSLRVRTAFSHPNVSWHFAMLLFLSFADFCLPAGMTSLKLLSMYWFQLPAHTSASLQPVLTVYRQSWLCHTDDETSVRRLQWPGTCISTSQPPTSLLISGALCYQAQCLEWRRAAQLRPGPLQPCAGARRCNS
jgi:hypothetical protein